MVKQILNGSQAMGRSKRTRVGLIVLCAALCAISFVQPQAEALYRPVNEQLDALLIRPSSRITIVQNTSVPGSFLYGAQEYQRWFENQHVWIHSQGLTYGEEPVAVLYVQFRNREEAEKGLARRMAEPIESRYFAGRVIGNFAVFINVSETRGEEIADRLYSLIERSSRDSGIEPLDRLD